MELPSPETSKVLEMSYVAPVWVIESINRDAETGVAVTYSTAWMRADMIRVVMEIGEQTPVSKPVKEDR